MRKKLTFPRKPCTLSIALRKRDAMLSVHRGVGRGRPSGLFWNNLFRDRPDDLSPLENPLNWDMPRIVNTSLVLGDADAPKVRTLCERLGCTEELLPQKLLEWAEAQMDAPQDGEPPAEDLVQLSRSDYANEEFARLGDKYEAPAPAPVVEGPGLTVVAKRAVSDYTTGPAPEPITRFKPIPITEGATRHNKGHLTLEEDGEVYLDGVLVLGGRAGYEMSRINAALTVLSGESEAAKALRALRGGDVDRDAQRAALLKEREALQAAYRKRIKADTAHWISLGRHPDVARRKAEDEVMPRLARGRGGELGAREVRAWYHREGESAITLVKEPPPCPDASLEEVMAQYERPVKLPFEDPTAFLFRRRWAPRYAATRAQEERELLCWTLEDADLPTYTKRGYQKKERPPEPEREIVRGGLTIATGFAPFVITRGARKGQMEPELSGEKWMTWLGMLAEACGPSPKRTKVK